MAEKCFDTTLKTLTSFLEESRLFLWWSTIAFGVFPLFPLAIAVFGGPEGYFSLANIGFGTFEFIVPKHSYRLGEIDKRSLDSLI